MSVLAIGRYRALTGDTATPSVTVSAAIDQATELLVDELGRELEQAERTETLWPTRDGYVWPSCTPIVAADGYTVDGNGIYGTSSTNVLVPSCSSEITYTGGWVAHGTPDATNIIPAYIERDLAMAAQALVTPPQSQYPAGAASVRLGDAAVTFGPDGPPRSGVAAVQWSRKTLRHRYSTTRGVPASPRGSAPW